MIHIQFFFVIKQKETPHLNFPNADSVISMKINAKNYLLKAKFSVNTRSAKHAVVAYEKYRYCVRS